MEPSFSKEGLGGLSISMRRIRSRNDKKKTAPKGCLSFFERKTRLEPTLRVGIFSRTVIYTPDPWKGRVWSLRASHRVKRKKQPIWTAFLRLSGKRDSNSLQITNISFIFSMLQQQPTSNK